jgi:hypothetical protein
MVMIPGDDSGNIFNTFVLMEPTRHRKTAYAPSHTTLQVMAVAMYSSYYLQLVCTIDEKCLGENAGWPHSLVYPRTGQQRKCPDIRAKKGVY